MGQIVNRVLRAALRQPEVEHLDDAVVRDRDVRQLEIAMDDTLFVRRFESVGDLPRDRQRLADRQPVLESPTLGDPRARLRRSNTGRSFSRSWLDGSAEVLGQRLAVDELEHQRVNAVAVLEPVDRTDVRMIEGREQPRFTLEARTAIGVGDEGLRQDLDRHVAPELRIARAVHLAHAAGSDQRSDLVRSEPLAAEGLSFGQRSDRDLRDRRALALRRIASVSEA